MNDINLEDLHGYLDEALSDAETARIERILRESASMRQILRGIMMERDRGEHSVGAIWRRNRLSCSSREELGSFVLGVLDEGHLEYIRFHLDVIGCPFCQANLVDLRNRQQEPANQVQQRRKKLFQTSAGYLRPGRGQK
jgi:hypothetical protein